MKLTVAKRLICALLVLCFCFTVLSCDASEGNEEANEPETEGAPKHLEYLADRLRSFIDRKYESANLTVLINPVNNDEYSISVYIIDIDFGVSKENLINSAAIGLTTDLVEYIGINHQRYDLLAVGYSTVPGEITFKDEPLAAISCNVKENKFSMKIQSGETYEFFGNLDTLSEPCEYEDAEYENYNSRLTENGLFGTPIKISGVIKEVMTYNRIISWAACIVATDSGDWIVGFYCNSIDSFVSDAMKSVKDTLIYGATVTVYGTYLDYSIDLEMPVASIIGAEYMHRLNRIDFADSGDVLYWSDLM